MSDVVFMRLALQLARRGLGATSPNPMVGAVLVNGGKRIGRGWHRHAGGPHAEIEAIRDAQSKKQNLKGATLFVTLEPCCTHGRTPPCTDAIIAAGIKRVVVAATDPNPKHAGEGFKILKRAGIEVEAFGVPRLRGSGDASQPERVNAKLQTLADEATRLNEAFNHWIVHRRPFVTVKSAMTLDGKIATARGESKWITGEKARSKGMKLRRGADAILVGVNTVIADDPSLTIRQMGNIEHPTANIQHRRLRRIILDPNARTPLSARIVNDEFTAWTTIVVTKAALRNRVEKLSSKTNVLVAPSRVGQIGLRWLLKKLGSENIASLLVEGGGETNAGFLEQKLVQRIAFFYAPKILCGRDARKSVAGEGIERLEQKISLREVEWRTLGEDLFLTARVVEG
ncbi:MAG: bifunctional diaminohydroxyphosphoribosylaminopyrimidine deaminase/5-amino-6-(5-phosphoribosylamino)uracil reductase RibD [Verrucomicrobiota bacterium]